MKIIDNDKANKFESSVNLYGRKTWITNRVYSGMFESSVNLYGRKTI